MNRYRNENLEPYIKGEAYFEIDANNTKYWRNAQGQRHREDGPAIEWDNGDKAWYFQGELHRVDGPAVELSNGDKWWWFHDQRHREDGPAIEFAGGSKEWYIEYKKYSEEEYEAALEIYYVKVGKKSISMLQREAEEEKYRGYWRTVEMPGEYTYIEL